MYKTLITSCGLSLMAASAFAVSVTVAPSTGVGGTAVTNTVADAITQINAGGDASNTITLRSSEGAIQLADNEVFVINAGKNIDIVAESGSPVVVLNWASGRYMVDLNNDAADALTVTGITFVPETGFSYSHNTADGFQMSGGSFTFTGCTFAANDGSDGAQAVDAAFGTNNVGDDWIQFNLSTDVTFSDCSISGSWDDAVLIGGGTSGDPSELLLNNGTCIANTGGAGIQVFDEYSEVTLDGSAGRVQIAQTGNRAATTDVGIKFFWDVGCSLVIDQADIITTSNGALWDFEGVPTVDISNCRIAYGNWGDVGAAGNIAVDDTSNDSAYAQTITIYRATVHDALGTTETGSINYADGANDTVPAWTITNTIFSGASDTFDMLNGVGGTVSQSFNAVVTAGTHAVGAVGDLGAGAVSADPQYASEVYTVGKNQPNVEFLLPTNLAYQGAGSNGTDLAGGSPADTVPVELSIFSVN